MRLTRLRLRQVCQHASLDWEFERGLVGIYGPNGSGKSNAMNVACYAGFTNDYSRHVGGKSGMIRQQAGEKDSSEILIDFEHRNSAYTILRGLRPAKHRMYLPHGTEIRKANEIQAELYETLGLKRRLIDEFIFVDQHSLFAFISAVPSERAKAFAHLCNTVEAEQIWEMLGNEIPEIEVLASQVVDNRDEIRQQIGEYKTRKNRAIADRDAAEAGLLTKAKKEAYDAIVANRNRFDLLTEQLSQEVEGAPGLKTVAVNRKKALRKAKEARDVKKAEVDEYAERYEQIIGELATLSTAQERWDNYQEAVDALEAACEAHTAATMATTELEDPGFDIDGIEQEKTDVEGQIRDVERLSGLTDASECPTCGQPLVDFFELIEHADEQLEELRARREQLKEMLRKQRQYDKDNSAARKELARTEAAEVKARETLARKEKPAAVDLNAADSLTEEKEAIEALDNELETANEALTCATTEFNTAKERHQSCLRRIEEKQQELAALAVSDADFEEAEAALARHTTANSDIKAAKARIDELNRFIETKKADLKKVTERLKRSHRARKLLAALREQRDEVFHRDKLPHVVHRSQLQNMEDTINDTLGMFDSPFHVTTTEDISFTAHFRNGTDMPAGGLSGGQKVMLAMAYRLTVNSLFAAEVGMMVLDEPTDGLDADNKDLASEVFRKLGEVARNRGHQVIVITHDETLQNCFNQRLVLGQAV